MPHASGPCSCSVLLQWYSFSAPNTGLLNVKVCSPDFSFTPSFVLRTDALSAEGGGTKQLPGCGTCDSPLS
jgi:hypothetical protein